MAARNQFLYLFLTYILSAPLVIAQNEETANCDLSISGNVKDPDTQLPIPFANVYIKELEKGGTTDEEGNYQIDGLCAGTYTISCSFIGCETKEKHCHVEEGSTCHFHLHEHTHELQQITIKAEELPLKNLQAENTLKGLALAATSGQNLGESLTKITGVTTLKTGNTIAKPMIRGLHSQRVLVMNNGVKQAGQDWGREHAPEIDPFVANELKVVKGANSVRYGSGALGGVILVKPKPLQQEAGIGGKVNIVAGTNGRKGTIASLLEGRLKKIPLSWRIQGTLNASGNIHTPDYHLANTGTREYNYASALGYKKENYGVEIFHSWFNNKIGIFSGAHIGNTTDLQNAFLADRPLIKANFTYQVGRPYQLVQHEVFKAKSFVRTGDIGKLNVTLARQFDRRSEFDSHKGGNQIDGDIPELKFFSTTHTGDLVWEHQPIHQLKGSIGFSTTYQDSDYKGRLFIPAYQSKTNGLFWIERWQRKGLTIESGVRYDRTNLVVEEQEFEENYQNISGTLASSYQINENWQVKADIGTAWRPPHVSELFSDGVHHGSASYEVGNQGLEAEKAYNTNLSLHYQQQNKLAVELQGYYNTIQNYSYLEPQQKAVLTIRGAFPLLAYQQVNARLTGLDWQANYQITPQISFNTKGSVVRGWNQTDNDYLINMPADRLEHTLLYQLVKENDYLKDTYISLAAQQVFTQKRIPSGIYWTGNEASTDNDELLFLPPPPKAYTLFTITAGTTATIFQQKFTIHATVNNVFNTTYRDYLDRFRYFTDAMGRNIVLRVSTEF